MNDETKNRDGQIMPDVWQAAVSDAVSNETKERTLERLRSPETDARLVDGQIMPGAWQIPGRGSSRFYTRAEAEKQASMIAAIYGPGVWESKVEPEPSRKNPQTTVFQVYIRSLGAIEGLRK